MAANNVSTLDGLFKDQFHKDVENLVPDHALLQKDGDNGLLKWVSADKLNGELYSVPTVLRTNQGVSYLGEGGSVQNLKAAKNAVMKEAQIKGSEMNVRGQISYKALSQAAEKGARAFKKTSAWLVEDLAFVMHTRVEVALLHGQDGLGIVNATLTSATSHDVVISEASFAPGLWILLEGAAVQLFTSAGAERQAGVVGTVGTVTTSTRTVALSWSAAITPTATDVLFFDGARTGVSTYNEMVGLVKQLSATSGTMFGIDRGAYALLQGNVGGTTGAISKTKITDFAMTLIDKGAMGRLVCLVSTKAWGKLNNEDMALRRFDSSYSKEKSKSGSKELCYEVNLAEIRVIAHPFVKQGQALLFNPEDVILVGSSKPTFEIPGFDKEFFRLVDGSNAVELQNYADLAVYALKPAQGGVMTGITYA
jgi:hypothetical protein